MGKNGNMKTDMKIGMSSEIGEEEMIATQNIKEVAKNMADLRH